MCNEIEFIILVCLIRISMIILTFKPSWRWYLLVSESKKPYSAAAVHEIFLPLAYVYFFTCMTHKIRNILTLTF